MATRYGSLTLQIKALSNLADIGSAYTDTLISATGTQGLSKAGSGSFTVSGRAATLADAVRDNIGQVAYVYVTDAVASGAAMDVCAFIIQDIDTEATDNGAMLRVSGPDILHQLTYTTLDSNAIDDGAGGPSTTDIDDIMAYAPSGWANTGGNSTNGTYHFSQGNNVLEILIAATKQSGGMFRLSAISPPSKTVVWLNSADSSGVTLLMPDTPIDYDASTTTGIILSLQENLSLGSVVTRMKPHGAGLSDGRLNIRNITSGDTGGDPTGYTTYFNTTFPNTIVNDTLETSLGYIIKQDVDFSHIRAADVTNATELTTAAVALWNEGIAYLQERDSSKKTYDVACVVPYDLKPGQTVEIDYTEDEGGLGGGNDVWTISGSFTIHSVSNSVGNSGDLAGVRITSLTVGESHMPRPTGNTQMAAAARTARETTRKSEPTTAPTSVTQARAIATNLPLTGGGDFSADRTHGLGTLTSYGAANQILGANAAATDIEYKTVTAGNGIGVTHAAGSLTVALDTPGTLTVATSNGVTADSHTHAITSSSSPGAAASILATDANGYVTLERLTIDNDNYIIWRNAADTASGGLLQYSAADDLAISNATASGSILLRVTDSNGVAFPYVELFEYGTTDDIQLRFSSHGYITTLTEGITIAPAAGQSLAVNLSTTGDFIVNTNQFVVDTSTARVGIGMTGMVSALEAPGSTTNSSAKFGAIEIQSYALGNGFIGDNLYFNGSNWKYRGTGYGVQSYFSNGQFEIRTAPSGTGGNNATMSTVVVVGNSGGMNVGDSSAVAAGGVKIGRASTSEPFLVFSNSGGSTPLGQARGINGGGVKLTNASGANFGIATNGTTLGFYDKTPITKQTGVAVTASGIHAALVNLGLIT